MAQMHSGPARAWTWADSAPEANRAGEAQAERRERW